MQVSTMLKMLPLRSFRWEGTIQKLQGNRTKDASGLYKHFSSAASRGRIRSKFHEPPSVHLPSWRKVPQAIKPFSYLQTKRFASTDLRPPTHIDSSPSSVAQPAGAPVEPFVSSPPDSITSAEYPRIVEHLGYLRDLGLDYGWGPTSVLQNLLEHVHIYTGTGWGVSVLLTALLIRLVLLKAYISASDVSARVAVVAPTVAPIKARLKEARVAKDTNEMKIIAAELKEIYRAAGIQNWKIFVPMLQVPLGFGTFRLMRGMADLPVPGLDSAGFLWVTDLTASDPYFILPVLTGVAFHLTFKKGGELGAPQTTNEAMQTTMLYGLPLVTSAFMLFWPGVLQVTFAFTSLLSLVQSYLLRQPWMRHFLQIQPLPGKKEHTQSNYAGTITRYQSPLSPPPVPPVKKGIIGGAISEIKGAASQVMTSARRLRDSGDDKRGSRRRSPAEVKRAQEYEQRRRREIAQAKSGTKRSRR